MHHEQPNSIRCNTNWASLYVQYAFFVRKGCVRVFFFRARHRDHGSNWVLLHHFTQQTYKFRLLICSRIRLFLPWIPESTTLMRYISVIVECVSCRFREAFLIQRESASTTRYSVSTENPKILAQMSRENEHEKSHCTFCESWEVNRWLTHAHKARLSWIVKWT